MGAINAVTDLTAQGDVAVLTVNSPPVNALSQQVRDGIVKGMQQAIGDAAVKAVVLI
jgi:3-hydroxyacyl-CoA dehydrogenase